MEWVRAVHREGRPLDDDPRHHRQRVRRGAGRLRPQAQDRGHRHGRGAVHGDRERGADHRDERATRRSRSATATAWPRPGGFLFATIVLTLFAVGFVAMARHVTTTGAFYGFISQGLGQVWGMAAGLVATLAYVVFEGSLIGVFSLLHPVDPGLVVGHQAELVPDRRDRHRADRPVRPLRHQHRGRVPRRLPRRRGAPAGRDGVHGALPRRWGRRPDPRRDQPAQRVQVTRRRRQHARLVGVPRGLDRRHPGRRRLRRDRRVLRLLVVGRLRDHGGLRRGVARPEADRAPGDDDRGRRPGHLLHLRVLDGGLRHGRQGVDHDLGRQQPGRPDEGHLRAVPRPPVDVPLRLPDRDRLLRLRVGVPQRGVALHLRDRP